MIERAEYDGGKGGFVAVNNRGFRVLPFSLSRLIEQALDRPVP
jgi:hypothetical protein